MKTPQLREDATHAAPDILSADGRATEQQDDGVEGGAACGEVDKVGVGREEDF
jgi:hypothetical protein